MCAIIACARERVNEEAAKIAKHNPALHTEHGRLLVLARKVVIDSGYQFKKGRSRSKMFSSGEKSPKAKRQRTDVEVRMARINETLNNLIAAPITRRKCLGKLKLTKNISCVTSLQKAFMI